MPEAPYAALVRRVTFENISRKDLNIECIDGLPALNPYGLKDWLGKHISRTVDAVLRTAAVSKLVPTDEANCDRRSSERPTIAA